MSELAEGEARASVPEAMTRNLSGFFFIDVGWVVWLGCLVGLFYQAPGPGRKRSPTTLEGSGMVALRALGSIQIRNDRS